MLGNIYLSDNIRKKIDLKHGGLIQGTPQPSSVGEQHGYVYSAGCLSVSRLLIQLHILLAP